jgi:hypothetical protein
MFLKQRRWLINKLAGEDIAVIINTKIYDIVLLANEETGKNCLYRRNRVISHEKAIQDEVAQRINLDKQGISKQGNAFVLK